MPTVDLARVAQQLSRVPASDVQVVCLPDFFVDHFVPLPRLDDTLGHVRRIYAQTGGNLPVPGQSIAPGGNAGNTALALARLGVRVRLLTRTSPFGRAYLSSTLGEAGVDLSGVRADGELAITTALEIEGDGGMRRNVMFSSPGSVADFGPERLTSQDVSVIEQSDLVLVANWTLNGRGTDLAAEVTRLARKAGTRAFVDTGDPSARERDVQEFLSRVLASPDLDVLGINENELKHYARTLRIDDGEPLTQARAVRARMPRHAVLELHTADFACALGPGDDETLLPTFQVAPLRVTGAGDAWNAGACLGHATGLAALERLALANAVAGLYVSGVSGRHPSLAEVVAFLERKAELKTRGA